jgi:hypothetical protein
VIKNKYVQTLLDDIKDVQWMQDKVII